MKIGILALQGAVSPHIEKLHSLGIQAIEVRTPDELEECSGIILPGGESTAILHLLKLNRLWDPLKAFAYRKPTWGICAGAILLASKVNSPSQESLESMDLEATRNAYGRQMESFISPVTPETAWIDKDSFEGVFIRAPRISPTSGSVKVLFSHDQWPVMVEQKNLLASTFHPELTASSKIHQYFVNRCKLQANG